MSLWIENALSALEDKPVLLLHGNVRDRYIDGDGAVYENLTHILSELARRITRPAFTELVFFDPVSRIRRRPLGRGETQSAEASAEENSGGDATPPRRILARWNRELAASDQNRFVVLNYLDKLVSFKESYNDPEERECLLWLEKIIENITPNHRLVMVALNDSLIPIELYTHSPKCRVLPIPVPDKKCRALYLSHGLGKHEHGELIADLTDGLYLRELDRIVEDVKGQPNLGSREVRRIINRYRVGKQQDYWGSLGIDKLNTAKRWFIQEEGIKGQDQAVDKVVQKLLLARAGLTGMASGTSAKPKGVLFFAGPTGVGKTFLAKKLAKFLFNTEEAFVRFDMSEYKEEHTVSKLIGSPPGYIGYERGGMLTNAIRERPFSVVLFDEIEKAHPKIMDIYLQLLDEGRLTDSRGQTIFFSETLIIFTSNLGCRSVNSRGHEIDERQRLDRIRNDPNSAFADQQRRIRAHFVKAVEQFFTLEISRPELLNRIGGNIVPFNFIQDSGIQRDIVRAHLKRIAEDFADKFRQADHRLEVDEHGIDYLVATYGRNMEENGGRGVTNALEDEVLAPVAPELLAAEIEGRRGLTFHIVVHDGALEVEPFSH